MTKAFHFSESHAPRADKPMRHPAFAIQLGILVALGFTAALPGQEASVLPIEQRTNGAATLDALSLVQSTAKRSVVQILDEENRPVQLGIVVSDDGYILTKASEAPSQEHLTLAWFDGSKTDSDVVLVDSTIDLMLARSSRTDAVPVVWSDAHDWRAGTWVCAFDNGKPKSPSLPLRLGNISAQARFIRHGGAALGVQMDFDASSEGVRIIDFGADSPAEKAGLRREDVIFAIDDVSVTSLDLVQQEISHRQPGDQVKVHVRRDKAEHEIPVRLASKSKLVSNWTGEDYANGGVSLRTDNFPKVLQHQMPLSPQDMGGPLLDLDGKAIGLNIARVDRVTTFALPVDLFWNKVQQWIVQSRKTSSEEVRAAEIVK